MPFETIVNDPVMLSAVVAAGAGAAGVAVYRKFGDEEEDTISTEGTYKRLKKIFTDPTETQGSTIKDYVKMRGTSNTPQLVGFACKAKEHSINVMKYNDDDDKFEAEEVDGTTYTILEGREKIDLLLKRLGYKISPEYFSETYDVPKKHIIPGDDYIWFSNKAHFVKFNGVHRHFDLEGMGRTWDASFAKVHENYLETKGDMPEGYAALNQRIQGQLKMENIKSENIRQFKKEESLNEKGEAMEE